MLVAGQRMADQHRVAALGIERAIGLVTDLEWSELDAGIERQRLIHAEADDERVGIVGLARAVGGMKCDAEIGLDHRYNPAGEAEWPPIHATCLTLGWRERLR